jgi:hypothetical protein
VDERDVEDEEHSMNGKLSFVAPPPGGGILTGNFRRGETGRKQAMATGTRRSGKQEVQRSCC